MSDPRINELDRRAACEQKRLENKFRQEADVPVVRIQKPEPKQSPTSASK